MLNQALALLLPCLRGCRILHWVCDYLTQAVLMRVHCQDGALNVAEHTLAYIPAQ